MSIIVRIYKRVESDYHSKGGGTRGLLCANSLCLAYVCPQPWHN
jgi:hypothetical protein